MERNLHFSIPYNNYSHAGIFEINWTDFFLNSDFYTTLREGQKGPKHVRLFFTSAWDPVGLFLKFSRFHLHSLFLAIFKLVCVLRIET